MSLRQNKEANELMGFASIEWDTHQFNLLILIFFSTSLYYQARCVFLTFASINLQSIYLNLHIYSIQLFANLY